MTCSITRVLFVAAVALAAVTDIEAMTSKSRPAHSKIRANPSNAEREDAVVVGKRASSGKVNGAYYPNWCVLFGLSVWVLH